MKYFCFLALLSLLIIPQARSQLNQHSLADSLAIRLPDFTRNTENSSPKAAFGRAYKIPLILVASGLFSITDNDILSREEVCEERNEWIPKFHHNADDYLQHAPAIMVYALNLAGVKSKNDFTNRTALLLKSELIVAAITWSLKKVTAVPRPDNGKPTSFPSGHTAQAFATATFLSKEYGHKSVWFSVGAYGIAATVGTMRVMNNRHWISDVLVGAGIGIFSTNIAYLTHQYRWGSKNKSRRTIVIPSYDGQTGMLSMVHNFN